MSNKVMYSVFRIYEKEGGNLSIMAVANIFKKYMPKSFDGFDPRGKRFGFSVCESISWGDHEKAINEIIPFIRPFLNEVGIENVVLEIDTAVYHDEDKAEDVYYSFNVSPNVMKVLGDLGISLAFTYY